MVDPYLIVVMAEAACDEYGGQDDADMLKLWQGCKQWRTEPPTETGWYWAIERGTDEGPIVVEVVAFPAFLTTPHGPLHEFSHWLGPLPVPEPPA